MYLKLQRLGLITHFNIFNLIEQVKYVLFMDQENSLHLYLTALEGESRATITEQLLIQVVKKRIMYLKRLSD